MTPLLFFAICCMYLFFCAVVVGIAYLARYLLLRNHFYLAFSSFFFGVGGLIFVLNTLF